MLGVAADLEAAEDLSPHARRPRHTDFDREKSPGSAWGRRRPYKEGLIVDGSTTRRLLTGAPGLTRMSPFRGHGLNSIGDHAAHSPDKNVWGTRGATSPRVGPDCHPSHASSLDAP